MRARQFFFLVGLSLLSSSTIGQCGLSDMNMDSGMSTSKSIDLDCDSQCDTLKTCKGTCPSPKFDKLISKKCVTRCYIDLPEGCECPDEIKRRKEEEEKRKKNPQSYPSY